MQSPLVIVPFVHGATEAGRLIDASARPIASVLEPEVAVEHGIFRDAVVVAGLDRGAAGVLFAAWWGGGGVLLT